MRPTPLLGCLLVLAGCDDFDRLAQLKPRRLTVRVNDISHFPDGGQLQVPLPVANAPPCQVQVDAALGSGWQSVDGVWVDAGVCALHDVLPGETLVRVPRTDNWLVVTQAELDLGRDFLGRPFAAASKNSTLTLDVSNAEPYSNKSLISMYLTDFATGLNNTLGIGGPSVGVPMASAGATSFPVTFVWEGLPLLSEGERIEVYQSSKVFSGNTVHLTMSKHGTAALLPVDSRAVRGPMTMAPIATAATPFPAVRFDPRSVYPQIRAALPSPTFVGCFVNQQAVVPEATVGLAVAATYSIDETTTFDLPPATGDPFPGIAWVPQVAVAIFYEALVTLPDASSGRFILADSFQGPADEQSWLTTAALTPPRAPRVRRADGSLITSGSLESTTPVLVWDPPTMGLPNRYQVQAYAVAAQSDGGVRTTQVVGRLFTERTEGHVPPGMLQPGTSYVFQIAADNCTASDPGRPVKLNWQTTCGLSQNVSLVFTTPSP